MSLLNTLDKKIVEIESRVTNIEKLYNFFLEETARNFDVLQRRNDMLTEYVNGIMETDPERKATVTAFIKKQRQDQIKASTEEALKILKKSVEDGTLVPANEISANSVLVLKSVDSDGNAVEPSPFTVEVRAIPEGSRTTLIGKKVGDVVPDDKYNLTVLEIYEATPPKA